MLIPVSPFNKSKIPKYRDFDWCYEPYIPPLLFTHVSPEARTVLFLRPHRHSYNYAKILAGMSRSVTELTGPNLRSFGLCLKTITELRTRHATTSKDPCNGVNIHNFPKHNDDGASGVLDPGAGRKIKIRRIKRMTYSYISLFRLPLQDVYN